MQVGQVSERELFEMADYLVTSRVNDTVHLTCLADLFGVKILSGADSDEIFNMH